MARAKGDGKRFYGGKKTSPPASLSTQDWRDIFEQSRILGKSVESPQLLDDLNDAVTIYAKYGPDSLKMTSVSELRSDLNAWLNRTDKLKSKISRASHDEVKHVAKATYFVSPEKILERYFESNKSKWNRPAPADFVQMLEGVTKLSRSMLQQMRKTAGSGIKLIDFWLLWAALLVSIFRKHKVKFGRRTSAGVPREQFRSEVIEFIVLLQGKLNRLSWARKQHGAVAKALKLALPFSHVKHSPGLIRVFKLFSAGKFDAFENANIFSLQGMQVDAKKVLILLRTASDELASLNRNVPKK